MLHPVLTLALAILALGGVFLLVKRAFWKETMVVRGYSRKPCAKTPTPVRVYTKARAGPQSRLAPSPIDATMVPNGSWDTNRNPSDFVTNLGSFPVPEDSDAIPNGLKWKAAQRFVPQMPDVTFNTGFPDPTIGGEFQFDGVFGRA